MIQKNQFLKIVCVLVILCGVSIMGYCGLSRFYSKTNTELFPLEISRDSEGLSINFEKKIKIIKNDGWGFYLNYPTSNNKKQINKIYEILDDVNSNFNINFEIYDDQDKLIKSLNIKPKPVYKNEEYMGLEIYGLILSEGDYRVKINSNKLKDNPVLFRNVSLEITNGHKPK
ncbi:hypothetical protein ACDX34_02230 [Acinetobacter bereziniae]|uniref:hypothetical protein n=1 Tax=Acinetobacter TaxID=469 RepID=UPI00283D9B19|nr:hypothetical protein [Acinetobacter sp.]MDR3028424.1 hypothetical protein [Acinetobacter sp.]